MRNNEIVIFCAKCGEFFKEEDTIVETLIIDKYNDNVKTLFHKENCLPNEGNPVLREINAKKLNDEIVFGKKEIEIFTKKCKECGKEFKTNIKDGLFCKIKCSHKYHHNIAKEKEWQGHS